MRKEKIIVAHIYKCVCRPLAAFLFATFALAGQAPAGNWNNVRTLAPGTEVRVKGLGPERDTWAA